VEALENLSDGFLAIDTLQRVTHANRAAETIVGSTREQMVGRHVTECFPNLIGTRLLGTLEQVLATRQPAGVLRTTVEGELLEVFIAPIRNGASVFLRNVSEQRTLRHRLRKLESRLWHVYESGTVGIAFGRGTRFLEANDAFLRMIGCSRAEFEASPPDWRDVTPPPFLARCERAWEDIAGQRRPDPFESEYVRRDGTRLPVVVAGAALLSGDEWACVVLDNSDRDRAAKFRDRLAAIVSHDLRTPLTSVMVTAAQAARQFPEPAITRSMDRIMRASARMTRIVEDVLDYSQAVLGAGIQIRRENVRLGGLIESVLAELQTLHPGRRFVCHSRGDPVGLWDSARVTRVLENILTNAEKFSQPETPITITWHPDDDGFALITVHNEGTPIPAELLPHIFEPFRTGHAGAGSKSLGLGLYIAREIVLAHKGQIAINSAAGPGTTVTIRLPCVQPH
jgi:PAS domain S-box-containing protein